MRISELLDINSLLLQDRNCVRKTNYPINKVTVHWLLKIPSKQRKEKLFWLYTEKKKKDKKWLRVGLRVKNVDVFIPILTVKSLTECILF